MLDLMKSYLTNREQLVKLNNIFIDKLIIQIGLPQGTVLGPILFVIYLNSLLTENLGGSIIAYADDTALIFSGQEWTEVREKAEHGLRLLKNWLATHKLTMNVSKTSYVAFSLTRANRPEFSKIKIDENSEINEVLKTKYLGVIIDQFLKWGPHVEYCHVGP